jgi:hypothetical protein
VLSNNHSLTHSNHGITEKNNTAIMHSFMILVLYPECNATFNNISVISWWSVLLVEKIGVPEFDYGAYASNCNNNSSQKSIT